MLPALLVAALTSSGASAAPVRAEATPVVTLITGVDVFGADGNVTGPHDVLLEGGRIARIDPLGGGWRANAPRVVDGRGATLMPGLVDVHVHVGSTAALPGRARLPRVRENLGALLTAGVTTVLDPGWDRTAADRWRERISSGRVVGPEIFTAGRPFTAPGGHPRATVTAMYPSALVRAATRGLAHEVQTADDVDEALASQGLTHVVKVMLDAPMGAPTLDDAPLGRLRAAATAFGVPLVAHVGRPEDVDRALALPVDALVHLPWAGRLSEPTLHDLTRIPVAPTLAVWDVLARTARGEPDLDALAAERLPRRVRRQAERLSDGRPPLPDAVASWLHEIADAEGDRLANVRGLLERDGTVLVGSDTPTFWLPAGAGTHREIGLLIDAGMAPADALVAATWTNSRFLDPDARFGAVRVGYEADLLLVDGDPTRDPGALSRIRDVWVDGRRLSR